MHLPCGSLDKGKFFFEQDTGLGLLGCEAVKTSVDGGGTNV